MRLCDVVHTTSHDVKDAAVSEDHHHERNVVADDTYVNNLRRVD